MPVPTSPAAAEDIQREMQHLREMVFALSLEVAAEKAARGQLQMTVDAVEAVMIPAKAQKSDAKVAAIHRMHLSLVLQMVMKFLRVLLWPLRHVRALALTWRTPRRLLTAESASLARRATTASLQTNTQRCRPLRPLRYISQMLA